MADSIGVQRPGSHHPCTPAETPRDDISFAPPNNVLLDLATVLRVDEGLVSKSPSTCLTGLTRAMKGFAGVSAGSSYFQSALLIVEPPTYQLAIYQRGPEGNRLLSS